MAISTSVKIRYATKDDLSSLVELEQQCLSAAHWTLRQYQQLFEADVNGLSPGMERLVRVAEMRGTADSSLRIAGFLVARFITPEWELENIVVDPLERRKGLGERLLDSLLARARESNSTAVFLEVRESNSAARRLYEKAAFKQAGRRKSYYSNPFEDAIVYRWTDSSS